MAGLARRLAPAAALGGLAIIIVGVADPAIAGRTESTGADSGAGTTSAQAPGTGSGRGGRASDSTEAQTPAEDQPATDPSTGSSCDTGDLVTGEAVMTRWGPVQVAATVSGTRVCEVHAVDWPADDGRSQMINAYAIPQLDAAATSSEGTQLDYVSGATYSSDAYARSLQSILDAL